MGSIKREDLDRVDFSDVTTGRRLRAVHPGEILLDEFMTPLNITQYRLAQAVGVPPRRINEIVHGKRSITADTALRLSRYFGTTAEFWINLQAHYELRRARAELKSELAKIEPLAA